MSKQNRKLVKTYHVADDELVVDVDGADLLEDFDPGRPGRQPVVQGVPSGEDDVVSSLALRNNKNKMAE